MKKTAITGIMTFFVATMSFAQNTKTVATPKNSWLKAGASAGIPVGDISKYSNFTAGIELSGQIMQTPHFGIGIASGYTHFFPKANVDGFGVIPLGLMFRYYPQSEGFFAGIDLGYGFITNVDNSNGGLYVKPQLGYHNYNWNFYGFYNQVFLGKNSTDLQNIGIAATYNLRFN
jgi:hypothetical protein